MVTQPTQMKILKITVGAPEFGKPKSRDPGRLTRFWAPSGEEIPTFDCVIDTKDFDLNVDWCTFHIHLPFLGPKRPIESLHSKLDNHISFPPIPEGRFESRDFHRLRMFTQPISEAIQSYTLTKTEYNELQKLFFPSVDPNASRYFGDLLKEILEAVGYVIVIEVPDFVEHYFPLVQIDRTTVQDLLQTFINKGIFANYTNIPEKEDILEKEKSRLKKTSLTFQEQRQALTKAGEYKTNSYVMRDYGDYAIGFSSRLYIDYIEKTEDELRKLQKDPFMFPDMNKRVDHALKKIKLYKLGYKIAMVILSEVSIQKKLKGINIPKKKMVEYLGYGTGNKQIYGEIKDAIDSLRWLDYILFDYNYTTTTRIPKKEKGKAIGNFIYNLEETHKDYFLDINDKFVGCVSFLWGDKIKSRKKRREMFSRGYFKYPPAVISLTGKYSYSTPATLLTDLLIRDSGNKKLKKKGFKIVTYAGKTYCKHAHITHSRANRRWQTLLDTIKEIQIIKKTSPTIEELESLKPSDGLKKIINIYIIEPETALDKEIKDLLMAKKSNVLGAK